MAVEQSVTLAEGLPMEQARVREVLEIYHQAARECPQGNCSFAIAMIKQSLANADKAAASGDTVAMLRAYSDLKEIE